MFIRRMTLTGIALLSVAVGFVSVAAADEKAQPVEPITTKGDHTAHGGRVFVYVRSAEGGIHRVSVGFASVSGKKYPDFCTEICPAVREGTPWFVYPESAERVWVFNGADELRLHEGRFSDDGKSFRSEGKTTSAKDDPSVIKLAPKGMTDRLPKSYLDSFKEKR